MGYIASCILYEYSWFNLLMDNGSIKLGSNVMPRFKPLASGCHTQSSYSPFLSFSCLCFPLLQFFLLQFPLAILSKHLNTPYNAPKR